MTERKEDTKIMFFSLKLFLKQNWKILQGGLLGGAAAAFVAMQINQNQISMTSKGLFLDLMGCLANQSKSKSTYNDTKMYVYLKI